MVLNLQLNRKPGKFRRSGKSWIAILFGLIFFAGGLSFLFFTVVADVYDGWRMQSWQSTQAKLLATNLNRNYSNNADTFNASARYEYTLGGQRYISTRVAIADMADNIGNFQKTLAQQLRNAFRNRQPITIWYDPQSPTSSVINRDIRWGLIAFKMIFVIVFGGIGFAMLYYGFKSEDKMSRSQVEREQPWLVRPEWKNGAIKSNAKSSMVAAWGITLFWNAISFPASIAVLPEIIEKQELKSLAVFIFPLIGLGLLYWAVKTSLQWRRFGYTPLTMDPYPGSIAGQVGGHIRINCTYQPQQIFKVTLSCIYSYMSGSSKSRSRKENTKWLDEGYAQVNPGARAVNIYFCFDVPDNLPASDDKTSESYHLWRLTLESEMDGTDLNRNFEIPVYKTGQQSAHINFKSPELLPAGVEKVTTESLLPLSHTGSSKTLYYPMLRKPSNSLAGVIFGGIFAAVGVFLWQQAQTEGGMLYFMASVFSLIGFGVVLSGIYSAFNSLQIKFDGISLHYRRRFLFFTLVDKVIAYTGIAGIGSSQGGTGNIGGKHRIAYKIFALVKGKKYTLVESIDSASKKDQVIEYFEKEISR